MGFRGPSKAPQEDLQGASKGSRDLFLQLDDWEVGGTSKCSARGLRAFKGPPRPVFRFGTVASGILGLAAPSLEVQLTLYSTL